MIVSLISSHVVKAHNVYCRRISFSTLERNSRSSQWRVYGLTSTIPFSSKTFRKIRPFKAVSKQSHGSSVIFLLHDFTFKPKELFHITSPTVPSRIHGTRMILSHTRCLFKITTYREIAIDAGVILEISWNGFRRRCKTSPMRRIRRVNIPHL